MGGACGRQEAISKGGTRALFLLLLSVAPSSWEELGGLAWPGSSSSVYLVEIAGLRLLACRDSVSCRI